MTANLHHRILATLTRRYEQRIMNNVCRSDYIECMVASVLGADWRLTWADGWDWAPWDCEHVPTGTRLEIKQAAARQSWDHESTAVRRRPVFDIASRQGYWPRDGGPWIEAPGRLAHLYVFAWHGRCDEHADHRNAEQWQFLVTVESDLPSGQKSIGLARLGEIATRCGIADLRQVIEMARQRLTGQVLQAANSPREM